MKAIETCYNGYRFRSRLEARWAVFFDALGVKYEYEPEGFELDDGTWYLPDFYLLEHKCYVEVKPRDALSIEYNHDENTVSFGEEGRVYGQAAHDITYNLKRNYIIVMGDPVDVFNPKTGLASSHLFTLSECAYHMRSMADPEAEYVCATGTNCRECDSYKAMVSGAWIGIATVDGQDHLVQGCVEETLIPNLDDRIITLGMCAWFVKNKPGNVSIKNTKPSALKARQARFEHGENHASLKQFEESFMTRW